MMTKCVMDDGSNINLQLSMNPDCVCRDFGHTKKPVGLPPGIKEEVKQLINTEAGIQPHQIKRRIFLKIVDRE